MNKERELLKRVRDTLLELKETHYDLYWDIQTALDLREDLREPLAPQQISEGNQSMFNVTRDAFIKGVKFAEKMHGIGGEPLSNEQKRLEAIAIKQREAHGIGGGDE